MTGSSSPGQRDGWVVGAVVFAPQPDELIALLRATTLETSSIVLFLNSDLPASVEQFLASEAAPSVVRLGDGSNVGVGAAHNRLLEYARAHGYGRIVLFDQDSLPAPGMIGQLAASLQALADRGCRPAVVGPGLVAPDGRALPRAAPRKAVVCPPGIDCIPLDTIISSGSLIDVAAFVEIGPFREDLFIDFVDVEWCHRANSRGYSCWMSQDASMTHRLGSGVVRVPLLPLQIALYPPARAYTSIRNQIALMRLGHVPRGWKLRTAVRLVLQTLLAPLMARASLQTLRQIALGWRDGLSGRLGPPPGARGS